jgi:hypothetical protein
LYVKKAGIATNKAGLSKETFFVIVKLNYKYSKFKEKLTRRKIINK